jgi:GTP 3',8-cyclase
MNRHLEDSFGRHFSYLRLSVTDACNFRCVYCLPHGYKKAPTQENYLSLREIENLARAFTEMGAWKIRLTGGEPTLRSDLIEIVRLLRKMESIRVIALSTNGFRLKAMARDLREAGLNSLNVSVDSLDSETFRKVTGQDKLPEILEGIDEALTVGFPWVKINAVLMKDSGVDVENGFLDWIKERPVSVRFIELMPTGQNQTLFREQHVKGETFKMRLLSKGWVPNERQPGDGPAQEFIHPHYRGRFGIIAPYAKEFCSTCNRLRVTSYGALRLCLFGDSNSSLRHLLQEESQKEDLKDLVLSLLKRKEVSHYLPEGRYGNNQTFSSIGG